MYLLTDEQLADALRVAADVARGDRQHDLMTALDVLAQDHRPELRGVGIQHQLAYAVALFADPAAYGRRPVEVADDWCRRHGKGLDVMLRAAADSVEQHAVPAAA